MQLICAAAGVYRPTSSQRIIIDRNVTLLSPEPGAAVLNGSGTQRVIRVLPHVSAELDGLHISSGTDSDDGDTHWYGGGVRLDDDASATLSRCIVSECQADSRGGGVYAGARATLVLRRTRIVRNRARFGAGIWCGINLASSGATVVITDESGRRCSTVRITNHIKNLPAS